MLLYTMVSFCVFFRKKPHLGLGHVPERGVDARLRSDDSLRLFKAPIDPSIASLSRGHQRLSPTPVPAHHSVTNPI